VDEAAKMKGSRAWKKLQRRKSRFLAKQVRRTRDMEDWLEIRLLTRCTY
jgi:hypothetical protein